MLLAVEVAWELRNILESAADGGTGADAGLKTKTIAVYWPSADGGVEADGGTADHEGLNALFAVPLNKDEREALLDHVAQGATLLYVPSRPQDDPAARRLGVQPARPRAPSPRTSRPRCPLRTPRRWSTVEAPVRGYLDLQASSVPLLDDEEGAVVMALVPHGQGQVLVLTAPDLASNQWLAQEDNAQLWLSTLRTMAAAGTVIFDEYHHGFRGERSVAELASRYGLHFAIAQLLLGLCLWGAALRRFGRPRAPPEDERLAAADALFAISRIYREGRHRAHAAQQVLKGLLQDLAPVAGRRAQDGPQADRLVARGARAQGPGRRAGGGAGPGGRRQHRGRRGADRPRRRARQATPRPEPDTERPPTWPSTPPSCPRAPCR